MTRLPEFRLSVRVKNNLLIQRREELGKSPREFAEAAGVSYGIYLRLEAMTYPPIDENGEWKRVALAIAECHGIPPEEIWPPEILGVTTVAAERSIDATTLRALLGDGRAHQLAPDEKVARDELRIGMTRALLNMSERESAVLVARFVEGKTHDEIATDLGVSRSRVQQIESDARRRMAHPSLGLDAHAAAERRRRS